MQPNYENIIRFEQGLGYIPIIIVDGKEVYRGEYRDTFEGAAYRSDEAMERLGLS